MRIASTLRATRMWNRADENDPPIILRFATHHDLHTNPRERSHDYAGYADYAGFAGTDFEASDRGKTWSPSGPLKLACIYVCQDGIQYDATEVFDELTDKTEMPVVGTRAGAVGVNKGENQNPCRSENFDWRGILEKTATRSGTIGVST